MLRAACRPRLAAAAAEAGRATGPGAAAPAGRRRCRRRAPPGHLVGRWHCDLASWLQIWPRGWAGSFERATPPAAAAGAARQHRHLAREPAARAGAWPCRGGRNRSVMAPCQWSGLEAGPICVPAGRDHWGKQWQTEFGRAHGLLWMMLTYVAMSSRHCSITNPIQRLKPCPPPNGLVTRWAWIQQPVAAGTRSRIALVARICLA